MDISEQQVIEYGDRLYAALTSVSAIAPLSESGKSVV